MYTYKIRKQQTFLLTENLSPRKPPFRRWRSGCYSSFRDPTLPKGPIIKVLVTLLYHSPESGFVVARTSELLQPDQDLHLVGQRCHPEGLFAPGTPVISRPLQHLQVTHLRSGIASAFIPRTSYQPQPLQEDQLPRPRRPRTYVRFTP